MTGRSAAPSLVDVARAAGVSTATAGRALGGYGQVSEKVRERVLSAAARLGYRPNGLARSMITGSTQTIGVIVTDVANPFFATALRGITDIAQPAGFEVLLANTGGDIEAERRAVKVMSQKRVDGLIAAAAVPNQSQHLQQIVDEGTPLVLLDREVSGLTAADSVTIDNESAARESVEHLLELGHARIGVITEAGERVDQLRGPRVRRKGRLPSAIRLLGYLQALSSAGVEARDDLIATAAYDRDSAHEAALTLLDLPEPPTALLCTDGVLAAGTFRALRERHVTIPDQISMIAFDDEPWTTLVNPELTVIEQPTYDVGVQAGRQLLRRLSDGEPDGPDQTRLKARLVTRASTGVARTPT